MKWASKLIRLRPAFTIVELMIVVAVLGILASITLVSYGTWQTRLAQNAVQSDLKSAAAALEQAKNFGSGYPLALPSSFKSGESVAVAGGGSSDGSSFCLQGGSTKTAGVTYYIDDINKGPQAGKCPSSGLVGWWPMDGNANDLSGGGHNGTPSNLTLTTDKNGRANRAYAFAGSGFSYISTPVSAEVNDLYATSGSPWSTSVWFTTPASANNKMIIGRGGGTGTSATYGLYMSGTTLMLVVRGAYTTVATNVSSNVWHYCAVTWNGSTAYAYFDGNAPVSVNIGTASLQVVNVMIGQTVDGSNDVFTYDGNIDDVRLYSSALSGAEVQALNNAGPQ